MIEPNSIFSFIGKLALAKVANDNISYTGKIPVILNSLKGDWKSLKYFSITTFITILFYIAYLRTPKKDRQSFFIVIALVIIATIVIVVINKRQKQVVKEC